MPLRYLFIDMNAFFASVEQQHHPELRGKPVGVIPIDAESTSCIAASYEAKKFGIKTGTPVWQARQLCPGIVFRVADHQSYVLMHNRVVAAVGQCIPVEAIASIDEMVCKLMGDERQPKSAIALAMRVKEAISKLAGDVMKCSIGIGPNPLLSKVAADMRKPDGLTVLGDEEIPKGLHRLVLTDFPGVGPRMEKRLHRWGIFTVEQFCRAPLRTLSDVWGSKIHGERWVGALRGEDVPAAPTRRQTVGQSHVLPPDLRSDRGAYGILVRLTHKACARLRSIGYWAGSASVSVKYAHDERWDERCRFPHIQDTHGILGELANLWARRPANLVPFQVSMVLSDLIPARSATPSLFDCERRANRLSHAMDEINREFGANIVYLGSMFGMEDSAPSRIAFTRIPSFDRAEI